MTNPDREDVSGILWLFAVIALAAGLRTVGDPAAIIARVLATDNPHGEPPPRPCPTCGHVKEQS